MANSLGALVVSLGLDATYFTSGMTKSEALAKRFSSTLDRNIAVGVIKAEVALRSLGAAAQTTFTIFQSLTTGAGNFKDLEETTGASAEALAGLAVAGATAGVSMESIGGAANKLTKSLVGVDDESKAAGAALKALGLDVKAFKELDPAAQYEAAGKALAGFADGAGKVAVAQALFGKSGAEQLKVFKALEEQGGRQTILTQRQIELSDAYADAQAKAAAQLRLYAQAAASEAVPALTDLAVAGVELAKALLGVDERTGALAANNGVAEFARNGADALADLIDGVQKADRAIRSMQEGAGSRGAVVNRLFAGDISGAVEAYRKGQQEIAKINDAPLFSERLTKARQEAKVSASVAMANASPLDARDARVRTALPTLRFEGPVTGPSKANTAAADAAREQRRILDGQLKEIRAFAEEQKDAFDFANRFVKSAYDAGLTTLQQTFDSERQIRDAALASTIAALDAEVRVLEAHARKASKPEARIDAENKIAEAVARRSQAERQAQQDAILFDQQRDLALAQQKDRYDDLRATILQLGGDIRGAADIRIWQQVADAKRLLAQSGQDQGLADTLGQRLQGAERLNQAQADYGALVERARLAEESILLTAREAGATELETLRAVGASRNAALQQMAAMVDEARELAAALDSDEARRYADHLAVAFQRARAEADPLLQKVRDIGREAGDAIASGFEDAIVSGGNLRDILKGIEQDLLRIVTRELVTKPLADYLTTAIGGTGQASGGGGLIGTLIGAIGSYAGTFAGGGDIGAGKWGIAGEAGPELIRGPAHVVSTNRSAQILDRMASGSGASRRAGQTINVNPVFHLSGPMDRRTQQQIAAETARAVANASARLN
jgi:hypothetical protein